MSYCTRYETIAYYNFARYDIASVYIFLGYKAYQ